MQIVIADNARCLTEREAGDAAWRKARDWRRGRGRGCCALFTRDSLFFMFVLLSAALSLTTYGSISFCRRRKIYLCRNNFMDDKVIAIDNRSNNKLTDIIKTFVLGPSMVV